MCMFRARGRLVEHIKHRCTVSRSTRHFHPSTGPSHSEGFRMEKTSGSICLIDLETAYHVLYTYTQEFTQIATLVMVMTSNSFTYAIMLTLNTSHVAKKNGGFH